MMANRGAKAGGGRARRAIIALSLVTALAAVVAFVAPRLVPSAQLVRRAEDALSAATGAPVKVGAARLTMLGGPGLILRDVRISRLPASEAAFDELDISLALAPLWRRELVVDQVRARGSAARTTWRDLSVELTGFACRITRLHWNLGRIEGGAVTPASSITTGGTGAVIPADLVGEVELTAARAVWSSFALEQVDLKGSIEGRKIAVRSLDAGCGGGKLRATAGIDLGAGTAGTLTGDLDLEAVEAAALLGAWVPDVATQLDARLTGKADVGCDLGGGPALLAGLTARGRLTTGEGLLRAGPWLGDVAPYLGDRQDLVDIRIASSRLVVRVADGSCRVDTLAITGPDTDWDLSGDVGLGGTGNPAAGLDLAVHVRLPVGFTPSLGSLTFFAEAMRDDAGRVNLDLRLLGPLPEPQVTLDLAAMSRRAKRPAATP